MHGAADVAIRQSACLEVARFASELEHQQPAVRYLRAAGQTRPIFTCRPAGHKAPGQPAVRAQRGQQAVGGTSRGTEEKRISTESVRLENTAQRIRDGVTKRPQWVIEATFRKPAIAALRTERPADIGQSRFAIAPPGLDPCGLEQAPGDVRFVFLFATHRERRRVLAPAAIVVLGVDQPVGGPPHRLGIGAELGLRCRQAQQDLSGVEGHRHERLGVDLAALKSAARQLDPHKPIRHPARSLAQVLASPALRDDQERGKDVAGRLRVRRGPAVDQAEVARDPTVGTGREILSTTQPVHRGGQHAFTTRVLLRQPASIAATLSVRRGRQHH